VLAGFLQNRVVPRRLKGIPETLQHGLIVSCQAEDDDPFNAPDLIARFAIAAEMGGAAGIRAREPDNIRAVRRAISLPIIGLTKGTYADGRVLITPDLRDVEALIDAGADLIAVDATARRRPSGLSGGQFVAAIVKRWPVPVVADVSTSEEGRAAFRAGAAAVATTLAGYTQATEKPELRSPDWVLLQALVQSTGGPVILEGRVWTPAHARRGLDFGAYAIVVGTAISRPRTITHTFVEAMRARTSHRGRGRSRRSVESTPPSAS
jgi:N-acylglucosamine-6-phosphate 2-epimerase